MTAARLTVRVDHPHGHLEVSGPIEDTLQDAFDRARAQLLAAHAIDDAWTSGEAP